MAQNAAYLSNAPAVFYFTHLELVGGIYVKETYAIGPSYVAGKVTFLADEAILFGAPLGAGISLPLILPVIRHQGTGGISQVSYTFINETAVNGVDYTGVNGTLTFQNDPVTGLYDWRKQISTLLGFVSEPKTFRIELAVVSGGATIGPRQQIQVTILPAPGPAGVISFLQSTQRQNPNTTVVLQVQRAAGAVGAVDVDFHTEDGTGVAGVDYTAATGQLSWADTDNANKTITVTLLGPATDKTFKVVLTDPTNGAVLGQIFETTVTIIGTNFAGDPGVFGFEYAVYQTPDSVTLSIKVKRVSGKSGAVSVDYQTANGTGSAGTDYTGEGPTTLNWADQDDADQTIDVDILNPTDVRDFYVNLLNETGGALISDEFGQTRVIITGGLNDQIPAIYDTFVDDFCSLRTSVDMFAEPFLGSTRNDVLVRMMERVDGGVIGFDGGSSNAGDGLEYDNNDQTLYPSPPNRFTMRAFLVRSE